MISLKTLFLLWLCFTSIHGDDLLATIYSESSFLKPVDWHLSNGSFKVTLIIDGVHENFTWNLQNYKGSGETGEMEENLLRKKFYYLSKLDLLIYDADTELYVLKRKSKEPFYLRPLPKPRQDIDTGTLLVPHPKGDCIWRIRIKTIRVARKVVLFRTLNFMIGGMKEMKGSIEINFPSSSSWTVVNSFQFAGNLYIIALYLPYHSLQKQLCFLIRLSGEEHDPSLAFKAIYFGSFERAEFFFTLENGEPVIYRDSIESRLTRYLFHQFDRVFNKSSAHLCIDFLIFLEKSTTTDCNRYSLPLFNLSTAKSHLVTGLPNNGRILSIIHIKSDFNETLAILENDFVQKCNIRLKNEPCESFPKSWTYVTVDDVMGFLVFVAKTRAESYQRSRAFRWPLINCSRLRTCASCEMEGYYHKCGWSHIYCLSMPSLRPTFTPSACFLILDALYYPLDDFNSFRVEIFTNYLPSIHFETFAIYLDGFRFSAEYADGAFVAEANISNPSSVKLEIRRRMGVPMWASFPTLKLGTDEAKLSGVFWAVIFFVFLALVIALLIILAFSYVTDRSMGSKESLALSSSQTTSRTLSEIIPFGNPDIEKRKKRPNRGEKSSVSKTYPREKDRRRRR